MGQTIRELAEAAAEGPCSSRVTLAVISSFSVVIGVLEVCELSETELSEGDSRLVFRAWCLAATAGDRVLPLPRIRPPPSDRPAMLATVDS